MSRTSRLCYHAVPRIVKTDTSWINASLLDANDQNPIEQDADSDEENKNLKKRRLTAPSENDDYNDNFIETLWNSVASAKQWKPFADYISDCRINMNVRQVLDLGEQSLNLK